MLDTFQFIPIDNENMTKLKKRDLVSRLMETDLCKGLGVHWLLSVCLNDLKKEV